MTTIPRDSLARSPLLRTRDSATNSHAESGAADAAWLGGSEDDDDLAYLAAADASSAAPFAQVTTLAAGVLQLRHRAAPRDFGVASVLFPRDLQRAAPEHAAQLTFIAALDAALLRWRLAAALFWFSVSLLVLAPLGWTLLALVLHASSTATVAISWPTTVWWALQCAAVLALAVARRAAGDLPHRPRGAASAWRALVRLGLVAATALAAAACALAVKSMRVFAANGDATRGSLWPYRLCAATRPELGECVDVDVAADWLASLVLAGASMWVHVRSEEFVDVYPSVDRRRLERFRARFASNVARTVLETFASALFVYVLLDGSGVLALGAEYVLGGVARPRAHAAGALAALAAVSARLLGFVLAGGISCFAWRAMRTALAIVSTEIVDVELLAPESLPPSLRSSRAFETPNLLALRLHDTSPAVRLVAAAALARAAQRAPLRRRLWSDAEGRALEPLIHAFTLEIRRCAWVLHCAMSRGSGRMHDAALWPDAPPPQLLTATFADVRQHYTARRRRRQVLYDRILDEMTPLAMVGFRFRQWLRAFLWRDRLSGAALTRSALPDDGQLVLFAVRSLAALLAAAPAEDQLGVCRRINAAPRALAALDQLIFALDLYCLSGLAHGDSGDSLQAVSEEALQLAPPVAALPSAGAASVRGEATPGRAGLRLAARQPRRAAASAVRQLPATPYALAQVARHARRTVAETLQE
jgi:hypothetical protein